MEKGENKPSDETQLKRRRYLGRAKSRGEGKGQKAPEVER